MKLTANQIHYFASVADQRRKLPVEVLFSIELRA